MSVEPLQPAEVMRAVREALPVVTDRIRLRALEPADLDVVRAYRNDPDQRRWMYSRDQTEAELMAWTAGGAPVFLRDGDAVNLGIEADGRLVGDVMLQVVSLASRQVELGWVVAKEAQGRGIATAAARALLDLAWVLGAHRVKAHLDADNEGSLRVAERIGMTVEGRFVDDEVNPATGEYGTSLVLAIRR